jgi:CRISPR-associated endonuclease/helicase Cas3
MKEPGNVYAELLAHIEPDTADGAWRKQSLDEHLQGTAQLAADFARPFGGADWAFLAGLWHDIGKAQPAWQRYIRSVTGFEPGGPARGPHHAIVGAMHAVTSLGGRGRILAYVIAGHHAGLADWSSADGGEAALSVQLERRELLEAALMSGALTTDLLGSPGPKSGMPAGTEEALHVFVRMLFSCLVDADSIDTERFSKPEKSSRRDAWPTLTEIEARLSDAVTDLPHDGAVNQVRWQVRDEVMAHATERPGFFSLTVPTGGGKTLTSLSFALAHARANGLRRVIYAIPYLSIIEQTADAFRDRVGKDAVLEHHSNLDPDSTDERGLLAAENWDAPLVVTTTVQLFESLFAAKRSRSRKVHNIAGSVIVLDEAQMLPPDYLEPILSLLRVLVAGYGVSVVLCTATQPALASAERSGRKFKGLDGVRELVRDPGHLFTQLDRVSVEWPRDMRAGSSWEDMAAKLLNESQVLCVVNTRADARALSALVPDSLHLSASMCAEHRAKKLADIKRQLKAGVEVRVVSTQLIEAGVDIDFPVVFRALAGLDSIAQSAGRCNREGKAGKGRVVVFVPPRPSPKGQLLQGEQATRGLIAASQDGSMLLRPEDFRRYFDLLYGTLPTLDRAGIMPLLTAGARDAEMGLRTAAEKFQMIDDAGTTAVLAPYGRGAELIRRLERLGQPDRLLLRRLQRYSVVLHEREFKSLLAVGGAREIVPGIYAVEPDRYDVRLGVVVGEASIATELVG